MVDKSLSNLRINPDHMLQFTKIENAINLILHADPKPQNVLFRLSNGIIEIYKRIMTKGIIFVSNDIIIELEIAIKRISVSDISSPTKFIHTDDIQPSYAAIIYPAIYEFLMEWLNITEFEIGDDKQIESWYMRVTSANKIHFR